MTEPKSVLPSLWYGEIAAELVKEVELVETDTISRDVIDTLAPATPVWGRIARRYWECECCASILVSGQRDDAASYACPQCAVAKCDHGGKYMEITKRRFVDLAEI